VHHEVDNVLAAFGDGRLRAKVFPKDGRKRVPVIEVKEAEGRDGDIDLARIDPRPEDAFPGTSLQNFIQHADEWRVERLQGLAILEVATAVQVLIGKENDKMAVLVQIVERELDEALHRLFRRERADIQGALALLNLESDASERPLTARALAAVTWLAELPLSLARSWRSGVH